MKVLVLFIGAFVLQLNTAQGVQASLKHQKPVPLNQSVTGEQVEQILATTQGKPDAEQAKQLYLLEPAARFGFDTIQRCQAYLAGPKAKQAFAVLADWSDFYAVPVGESSSQAMPDIAAQKQMMALTAEYVAKTLHHLPNFYATRRTTTFMRRLRSESRLHVFGKHRATVYYRDGEELARNKGHRRSIKGLTTSGEFGPVLATTMLDAVEGNLRWNRWEQGSSGLAAVFVYEITATNSHYKVDGQQTAYQGEIAVDPSTGAVRRLVLKSEMGPFAQGATGGALPRVADLEIDYSPVDIGGKTYICPTKGVALSEDMKVMWLNETVFEDYHLFRGDLRILPDVPTAR